MADRRRIRRDGHEVAGDQPSPYQVRLYDGSREVLGDRKYLMALDLTPGVGMEETAWRLDRLLRTLAEEANYSNDRMRKLHLDVCEWGKPSKSLFLWPATWLDEPE